MRKNRVDGNKRTLEPECGDSEGLVAPSTFVTAMMERVSLPGMELWQRPSITVNEHRGSSKVRNPTVETIRSHGLSTYSPRNSANYNTRVFSFTVSATPEHAGPKGFRLPSMLADAGRQKLSVPTSQNAEHAISLPQCLPENRAPVHLPPISDRKVSHGSTFQDSALPKLTSIPAKTLLPPISPRPPASPNQGASHRHSNAHLAIPGESDSAKQPRSPGRQLFATERMHAKKQYKELFL